MRTTINLPDELYRSARIKAARDGRTVTSLLEEALRNLLAETAEDNHNAYRVRPLSGASWSAGMPVNRNAELRDLMDQPDDVDDHS